MQNKEYRSSVGFLDFVKFCAFRGSSIFSRKKAKKWNDAAVSLPKALTLPFCVLLRLLAAKSRPASETPSSRASLRLKSAAGDFQPLTGTDAELLVSLQDRDLAGWQNQTDAIPTRCQQALAVAIKEAEPRTHHVKLRSASLKNDADAEEWCRRLVRSF